MFAYTLLSHRPESTPPIYCYEFISQNKKFLLFRSIHFVSFYFAHFSTWTAAVLFVRNCLRRTMPVFAYLAACFANDFLIYPPKFSCRQKKNHCKTSTWRAMLFGAAGSLSKSTALCVVMAWRRHHSF